MDFGACLDDIIILTSNYNYYRCSNTYCAHALQERKRVEVFEA